MTPNIIFKICQSQTLDSLWCPLVVFSASFLVLETTHARTHAARVRLTALCPGLPGWAGTRKVKPIWILLDQETVSGSSIS